MTSVSFVSTLGWVPSCPVQLKQPVLNRFRVRWEFVISSQDLPAQAGSLIHTSHC